jgi:cytochrome c553
MPPTVKALKDIGFSELGVCFEFEEQTSNRGGGKMEKFAEFFEFLKFWKKFEKELDPGQGGGKGQGKQFSEADLEAAKKEAAEKAAKEAKAAAEAEFAEKQKAGLKDQRKKEISAWVEQRVKDGKLLPTWKDAGLVAFMEQLDATEPVQFAEGDANKKPALNWMQDFLDGFQKLPIFAEFASKQRAGAQQTDEQKQVEQGKRIAAKVTPLKK